jgi:hyaluronoglucosaminidase
MNRFLVAAKDDRFQREAWRELHPAPERDRFRELVAAGAEQGVSVGFAVSPGLSIRYGDARDVAALLAKLADYTELGSRFVSLQLDDVPVELQHPEDRRAFAGLAAAHVAVANAARDALGDDVILWLVPTDYAGVAGSDYLAELGAGLAPGIEVAWSGRSVLAPEIQGAEAAARAALLGRRLLIWDNTPVADGAMRVALHLGPYRGRDPDLARHASGVLLNPMQHARASAITIHTAADYLKDPANYDPERAWQRTMREIGGPVAEELELFCAAHRFSPLEPEARETELEHAFDRLRDDAGNAGLLESLIARRLEVVPALRRGLDAALARELEPWLANHENETRRMHEALGALAVIEGDADPLEKGLALARLEGRLTRLQPSGLVSYGPRRAFLPQLEPFPAAEQALSPDARLLRDRCLAEDVVRFVEDRALSRLGSG